MSSKTTAISIIGVQYNGSLIQRVVEEGGILPGHCLMVSDECDGVLVAGEKATTVFECGPHDLDLMMFNRQPSGLLYAVAKDVHTLSWPVTGYRRTVKLRVTDPKKFVQQAVVGGGAENDEELTRILGETLGGQIHAGGVLENPAAAAEQARELLEGIGCTLVDLQEAPVAGAGPPPLPVRTGGQATGPTAQISQTSVFTFTHVWASSTMDMFGKGELTLRVRLIGREQPDFDARGPFSYDATQEFLSPDDWLEEKTWQSLPDSSLRFEGLIPDQYYRLFIVAEERDKGSTDSLGQLETELGQLNQPELEIGPTSGGKRKHHIKLKARVE